MAAPRTPAGGDEINFVDLERELRAAIADDELRSLQNDAKLRAVQQRVGSYQQFRDLVKAAHLRPLEKTDNMAAAAGAGGVWNSLAARPCSAAWPAPAPAVLPTPATQRLPATLAEFGREWRRLDVAGRLALLRRMGAASLGHVLRAEVPAGLLGELLHVLLVFAPSTGEVALVVRLLQAVSEANRFALSLQFLSSQEKHTCQQLMHKLLASLEGRQQDLADLGITEWTIKELRTKYKV